MVLKNTQSENPELGFTAKGGRIKARGTARPQRPLLEAESTWRSDVHQP